MLSKRIRENGQPDKVIDYVGATQYVNNQLTSIGHAEGRIRPVTITLGTGGTQQEYEYDFFIKDHSGNVRSTVTEEPDANWWDILANQEDATAWQGPAIQPYDPTGGSSTGSATNFGFTVAERVYTVTSELNHAQSEEATFDHVAETRAVKPGATDPNDVKDTRCIVPVCAGLDFG